MTSRQPVPADRAVSPTTRLVLRVVGGVLLLAGLYVAVRGGVAFVDEMNAASVDSGPGSILMIGGGGFMVVLGLGLLNAGFLRAQARYASGEAAPAVRELGGAFRGESGSTGDQVEEQSLEKTTEGSGPFCSECGVRADRDARFCDACGHVLAPR